MRKILLFNLFAVVALLASCSSDKEFRVHGTATNPNLEGKCVYLIAMDANIRDSVGIDSAFIKDGKFEIANHNNMMGIIRMDYHFRIGTQELLVVEEPGDLYVTIDSISSCHGTKNNEALQAWKNDKEVSMRKCASIYSSMREAESKGDTVTAKSAKENLKKIEETQKKATLDRAAKLDEGPLKEFFFRMYAVDPETYK